MRTNEVPNSCGGLRESPDRILANPVGGGGGGREKGERGGVVVVICFGIYFVNTIFSPSEVLKMQANEHITTRCNTWVFDLLCFL